jgi:hypothetical protein
MERRTKTAHEMIFVHGFAKVTNDPIRQCARPDVDIWVGRHEDRRNRMPHFDEVSMELESGHPGHMNVGDQAAGFDKTRGSEEIGSRRESLNSVAE